MVLDKQDEVVQAYVAMLRRALESLIEVTDDLCLAYRDILKGTPLWFLYNPESQIAHARGVLAMETGRLAHQFWENVIDTDIEALTLADYAHGRLYGRSRSPMGHLPNDAECREALAEYDRLVQVNHDLEAQLQQQTRVGSAPRTET